LEGYEALFLTGKSLTIFPLVGSKYHITVMVLKLRRNLPHRFKGNLKKKAGIGLPTKRNKKQACECNKPVLIG